MSTRMIDVTGGLVVVTDEHFMHMRVTRIHHRHYPEVRAEGRSPGEALKQLVRRLVRELDQAHGSSRRRIERAIADVRATRASRSYDRYGAFPVVT